MKMAHFYGSQYKTSSSYMNSSDFQTDLNNVKMHCLSLKIWIQF